MYSIFIADDHPIIRQGLTHIIDDVIDCEIIGETGDGLKITPSIRKLKPDMIILDISMPNLRGIEAIHKIRKINKKVKILVLTMHKKEDYVYECLVSGAQGYILKEDADKELMAAIESLRRGEIYISSSFTSEVIRELVRRRGNAKSKSLLDVLTNREREILKLIAEGKSNKKIARLLSISVRTVEHHRLSIMKKLGTPNIAGLIRYAIKSGLVDFT